jgi:hypothetical protein
VLAGELEAEVGHCWGEPVAGACVWDCEPSLPCWVNYPDPDAWKSPRPRLPAKTQREQATIRCPEAALPPSQP